MRCKSSFPNGAVYEFLLTNTKPMESYSIHELAYMAYGPCFKIGAAVKNRFQFLIKLIPCIRRFQESPLYWNASGRGDGGNTFFKPQHKVEAP